MDVYSSIKRNFTDLNFQTLNYCHGDNNDKKKFITSFFPFSHPIISRPTCIIVETVNSCNHKCIFCPYDISSRKKSIMSLDLFEKVIINYLDIGGGVLSLTPMVGDIFLDPLLLKRMEYLENFLDKIQLSVTTNAVLSDQYNDLDLCYILDKFKKIQISIYGLSEEEYFHITLKRSYHRSISSIKRILNYIPLEKISFGFRLIYKREETEIRSWIKKEFEKDVSFNYTTEYNNWGCDGLPKQLPGDALWSVRSTGHIPCIIPLISIQIFSNGDVSMCGCADFDSSKDLKLGNIINLSLESMFNSKKVKQFFVIPWNVPEFCKKCSFYRPISENAQIWIDNPLSLIGG